MYAVTSYKAPAMKKNLLQFSWSTGHTNKQTMVAFEKLQMCMYQSKIQYTVSPPLFLAATVLWSTHMVFATALYILPHCKCPMAIGLSMLESLGIKEKLKQ